MDDWLTILSRRLKESETPLPEDSWNLFASMLPVQKKRIWPWVVASAASIAASIVLLFFNRPDDAPVLKPEAIHPPMVSETLLPELPISPVKKIVPLKEKKAQRVPSPPAPDEEVVTEEEPADTQLKAIVLTDDSDHKEMVSDVSIPYNQPEGRAPCRFLLAARLGGPSGSIYRNKYILGNVTVPSHQTGASVEKPIYSQPIASSSHSMPISFGLSVGYLFLPKFALTSGADITYYHSRIAFSDQPDKPATQHAYYLGIPAKVEGEIWHEGLFSAWLGAGTEVDRCVFAVLDGNRIHDNALHCSAMADLNIQYRLSEHLSIYLEPELTYSFKTQSPGLLTYRTESPLMFTVGAGLRFDFR